MFDAIRVRLRNARAIRALLEKAERHALRDQHRQPGAEHLLLAAIKLPDDTARQAFAAVGTNAASFEAAICAQYEAGSDLSLSKPEPLKPRSGLYRTSASGTEVMQRLSADRGRHRPLVGAHVVAAVAAMEHGVAARALRILGIDRAALQAAEDRFSD